MGGIIDPKLFTDGSTLLLVARCQLLRIIDRLVGIIMRLRDVLEVG